MSQEPENSQKEAYSEITIRLPERIVRRFDELKEQWGLERRGAVMERLLDEIFEEAKDNPKS
ncbi:hypothetical protein [Prochlorococcus sp. MIT 1223]|uniref:hypothetical protein n=1 Tax=Prochlorococcus sp. MIT 1223 TaxID=3096217 RepID=UPI002A76126C|nr:hypothetical protein [Prochlorococcus sp. MIT 1223]